MTNGVSTIIFAGCNQKHAPGANHLKYDGKLDGPILQRHSQDRRENV